MSARIPRRSACAIVRKVVSAFVEKTARRRRSRGVARIYGIIRKSKVGRKLKGAVDFLLNGMTNIAQEFLDRVAGALEVPAVSPDTDFRAGPLWDSLTAFALRVMIQQRFGKALSAAELEKCKTVADLMAAAGVEL